ncbi:50S ribosomal protein L4 [Patescibacteria group bacterium]|nr:50S ribosomal protein L4 [Patescibacteria group bacterium]
MSIKVKIYNQKAESTGEMSLNEKLFAVEPNQDLLHQAVTAQRNNARQVLAHTKTKSEVRGGGKKPWRQKGTGRARAGSSRSPIWIGGGVTFGPNKNRNFSQKINLKMKRKAILMALSDKVKNNALGVIDKFEFKDFKTKEAEKFVDAFEKKVFASKGRRSILVLDDKKDEKLKYSLRNLEGVEIININNINILQLLKSREIVLSEEALKVIEKRYNK